MDEQAGCGLGIEHLHVRSIGAGMGWGKGLLRVWWGLAGLGGERGNRARYCTDCGDWSRSDGPVFVRRKSIWWQRNSRG